MAGTTGRSRLGTILACSITASLTLLAVASAPAQESAGAAGFTPPEASGPPVFSPAQASQQLAEAVEVLTEADGPREEADVTSELRDLTLALPSLEGAERRKAKRILARPDDGKQVEGSPGWTEAEIASRAHYDPPGGDFRIHYVTTGTGNSPPLESAGGDPTVPDYVELVGEYAATSRAVQNDTLGWPAPKSDGQRGNDVAPGPAGLTDIYLSDLCCSEGVLFGYAAAEGPFRKCSLPPYRCFAYLVLDNDYAPSEYDYPPGDLPDVPLTATLAHEYNHVLQFRIDAIQDLWMFESTATWAEEKTFPDSDDWIGTFMPRWARTPHVPIAKSNQRFYGTAVWNHWLELGAKYGPGAILDAWKQSRKTKPKHFAPAAYHRAIKRAGGRGFPREFGRFVAATAEWRVPDSGFPPDDVAELPNVRRQGTLRRGARAKRFRLDHTAYRLLRTKPRGRARLRLRVRAPRGVRTMIALVGRDGDPTAGTVRARHRYLHRGGRGSIRLRKARRFERVTAVVANADTRVEGFNAFGGDWRFRHDDARYRAALR